MTVKYIPFESRTGFKSPGFEVDRFGTLTAEAIVVNQGFDVTSLKIQGIDIINNDDSSLSLGDSIVNSSLERVGTLSYLNVVGDVMITQSSSWVVSVVNGKITLTSGPEVGSMDNIAIGETTPATASFTTVTASEVTVTGNATVDNVSINNQPTDAGHATRKDYVDNKISAFSIAFGA